MYNIFVYFLFNLTEVLIMKALDDYNAAIESIKEAFGEDYLDGDICDYRNYRWRDDDYSIDYDIDAESGDAMYSAEKRRCSQFLTSKCGGYVGISLSDNGQNIFAIFDLTKKVK